MAKKKQVQTIGEIVSELSNFGLKADFFSRNSEVAEQLIRLQSEAINLMRLEVSIRRDFAELNLADDDAWDEFLERRSDFTQSLADLQSNINSFKKKIGLG